MTTNRTSIGIQINRSSRIPLYRQIATALETQIRSGELALGANLPAERSLAGELDVNRSTIVNAYAELSSAGLVSGRVGSGTRVDLLPDASSNLAPMLWDARIGPGNDTVTRGLQDLAAMLTQTDVISLGHVSAARDLIPVQEIQALATEIIADLGGDVLEYAPTEGLLELRQAIVAHMQAAGAQTDTDQILVTNGGQQGIDLIARCFVEPGDVVAIDAPGYPGALTAFAQQGARLIGVPVDADGMRIDVLQQIIQNGGVKLVFTMPNFSNPSGAVLSEPRRRALLEITRSARVPLATDDVVGALGFDDCPPPLIADTPSDHVIHIGSLSKLLLVPGLRIGWLAGAPELIRRIARVKLASDLATATLNQWIAARALQSGLVATNMQRVRPEFRRRYELFRDALTSACGDSLTLSQPRGGFSLWCRLTNDADARQLLTYALRSGVAFLPGDTCVPDASGRSFLRLCYGEASPQDLVKAAHLLAQAIEDQAAQGLTNRRPSMQTPVV
jgi:DNA-binding transcriptional MocR family regulator